MARVDAILSVLRRLLGNGALRRVLPAFFLFNAAEFGTWVAILLYAYERTGPVSVGVVALVQLVPAALLAPAAASLGDRYPRERVLATGYAVQGAALLATAVAMIVVAPPLVVYAIAAVAASSMVVTRPTQSALLPSLAVSPEELTAANAASGVVEGAGVLAGPLLAAAILTTGTPATVFLVAVGAVLVASILTMRLQRATWATELDPVPAGATEPDGMSALAGLRVIAGDRDARLVVGLLTTRMLLTGAADVLFVLLALDLLAMGEPGAGILAGALGAGAMVGGATTFAIVGRARMAVVFAVGAAAWGLSLAVIGATAIAALAPWLVLVGGAGLAVVDIAGRTMLQRSIRDEVLARVFGLQEGLAMAALAVGSIMVPILVGLVGLVGAVFVVAAILPLVVALQWPRLRELDGRTLVPVRELALLGRNPIFRPLPAPQLEAVARRTAWLTAPAGFEIIREGDVGDCFYVLASGALTVDRDGTHLRDVESPGDGVGEIALLHGVPRTASVATTADSTLLTIERGPFLAAVTGHPDAFAAAERQVALRML
jgi:MFS family permease